MSRLEVLHHIARLQSAGLRDGAGEEVDDDGVFVGGRDDEGEEELGEFGDAGDGVEVRFAKSADTHDGQKEGEDDSNEGGVKWNKGTKDDVYGSGAEDDREKEADEDDANGDEVRGWSIRLGDIRLGGGLAFVGSQVRVLVGVFRRAGVPERGVLLL